MFIDIGVETIYLADYIKALYQVDGVNDIYYHDGVGIYSDQEAGDNSYRYAGANPNNYICFGTDVTNCSDEYLYRIIGVFDNEVKIIKYSSIDSYYYGSSDMAVVDRWSVATLNNDVLNGTYLNGLGNWSSYIENAIWHTGGCFFGATVKETYNNEINQTSTTQRKIGLMYMHDYGYAGTPNSWSRSLGSGYSIYASSNWLYTGIFEWTIVSGGRFESDVTNALYINDVGEIWSNYLYSQASYNVRPVFYLNSDVEYMSGSGTQIDPYRIA